MLTPDYLEHIADDIIELYQKLDQVISKDIARRLIKTGRITDTAMWQANVLKQSGLLYTDVIAEVARYAETSDLYVKKAFEEAGIASIENEIDLYSLADINIPQLKMSKSALEILKADIIKTAGQLKNLTMTTAIATQQAFIDSCTLAKMKVSSGASDYNTAIREAIKESSKAGVSVLYPSGHSDKIDVAVRRAVLTGVNQTMCKVSELYANEFGCDIMELTAHSGARPNHANWQGKLVSLSGKRGYLSLTDIGYGTGAGFGGWNCRHSWNPFFVGISKRSWDKSSLDKLNEKSIEYNSTKYTEYEASQIQRSMERSIRATKRELAGLDSAIKEAPEELKGELRLDFNSQAVKLKAQEAKLKDMLNQTGRYPDNARVQVLGFGKSTSGKTVASARKHYETWLHDIGASDGAPKTLAGYYNLKYNKPKEFQLLMDYSKNVQTGWISPNVGYSKYKTINDYIEKNIIGSKTSNGIVITGQSKHFIQRICGTMVDPEKKKQLQIIRRSGVEIEDILDTLLNGTALPIRNYKNSASQLFIGNKCEVSINPHTGNLIQCNLKRSVKK